MYISTPPSPKVENFQMKIYYPAGDRTPDQLNQRLTCFHLSQRGELARTVILLKKDKKKYVALQPRRAKTDCSGCCQMAVQGALWLAKRLPLNFNLVFLTGFRYFSYQVATQLSSRGWVDTVADTILSEKFLGYSQESNPGPLGRQSYVLTTIPNRWW